MSNTSLATQGAQELHSTLCNAASTARSFEQLLNRILQQRSACQVDKKWKAFQKAQNMRFFIIKVGIACLFAWFFISSGLSSAVSPYSIESHGSGIAAFLTSFSLWFAIIILAGVNLYQAFKVKKTAKEYKNSALAYYQAIPADYKALEDISRVWCENYDGLIPESYQSSDVLYTMASYIERGLANTWQDCCKCFDSDQKQKQLQATIVKSAAAVATANAIATHTAASRVVGAVNTNTAAVNANTSAVNANTSVTQKVLDTLLNL